MIAVGMIEFCIYFAFLLFVGIVIGNFVTTWRIKNRLQLSERDISTMAYRWGEYERLVRIGVGEAHPGLVLDEAQKKKMQCLEHELAIDTKFLLEDIQQVRKLL